MDNVLFSGLVIALVIFCIISCKKIDDKERTTKVYDIVIIDRTKPVFRVGNTVLWTKGEPARLVKQGNDLILVRE